MAARVCEMNEIYMYPTRDVYLKSNDHFDIFKGRIYMQKFLFDV